MFQPGIISYRMRLTFIPRTLPADPQLPLVPLTAPEPSHRPPRARWTLTTSPRRTGLLRPTLSLLSQLPPRHPRQSRRAQANRALLHSDNWKPMRCMHVNYLSITMRQDVAHHPRAGRVIPDTSDLEEARSQRRENTAFLMVRAIVACRMGSC